MTIVALLRDNVFEPSDIQAMSNALDDVCKILNLPEKAASERELVAKTIIAFAHEGQRDAALLRDRMLREIVAGRGEWPLALVRTARPGALKSEQMQLDRVVRGLMLRPRCSFI